MAFIFVTVKTIFLCNLIISVILLWHKSVKIEGTKCLFERKWLLVNGL